jgi:hypothetical protein
MLTESQAMNEQRDCAVRAVAEAAGVPYRRVHSLFTKHGRKPRHRTPLQITRKVLDELGVRLVDASGEIRARTVRTLEKELPSACVFLVRVRGHILCCRDGRIDDETRGRLNRIREIYRVENSPPSDTPVKRKQLFFETW